VARLAAVRRVVSHARHAAGPAGAIVVFHDYDEPAYPGVTEAVRELGLPGEVFGHLFAWRAV
jgi:hypothetical protein